MVKEIAKIEKKEGLKHSQEIITKANEKIDFRIKEVKALKNEQLNMHEKLKGMEEVLHQREEESNNQLATVENARKIHHKDKKTFGGKEK